MWSVKWKQADSWVQVGLKRWIKCWKTSNYGHLVNCLQIQETTSRAKKRKRKTNSSCEQSKENSFKSPKQKRHASRGQQ